MAAWKMIGFPPLGDYRDYVDKHGERFPCRSARLSDKIG
jgi:hypothetical protein